MSTRVDGYDFVSSGELNKLSTSFADELRALHQLRSDAGAEV